MEKDNLSRPNTVLKSIMEESRKIRTDRGEDYFADKKARPNQLDENPEIKNDEIMINSTNYKKIRSTHIELSKIINEFDSKIQDEGVEAKKTKKPRSKSIHLYIDENIEHFLNAESKKAETKWGLRKNAGLGQLIQKFIGNFIELKKREERQLKRVNKVIHDFRSNLVDFKKTSSNPEDYQKSEIANQKMKVLSNDLFILLSLLEFEEGALKNLLGKEQFDCMEFVYKWKSVS
jgi:hypothetical protein